MTLLDVDELQDRPRYHPRKSPIRFGAGILVHDLSQRSKRRIIDVFSGSDLETLGFLSGNMAVCTYTQTTLDLDLKVLDPWVYGE